VQVGVHSFVVYPGSLAKSVGVDVYAVRPHACCHENSGSLANLGRDREVDPPLSDCPVIGHLILNLGRAANGPNTKTTDGDLLRGFGLEETTKLHRRISSRCLLQYSLLVVHIFTAPRNIPGLQVITFAMPHTIDPLRIQALGAELRKDAKLGAEVILPSSMRMLDMRELSEIDLQTLRKALFAHGVLVIRNQVGLEPTVLVELAKLFDPAPLDHHSGGAKQVTDPNNILSLNNCSRIPRAPQVTVIGKGRIENHQGLSEINLQHLDHLSFHERPLSSDAVREGFIRESAGHSNRSACSPSTDPT
jgi:hypothetical protein